MLRQSYFTKERGMGLGDFIRGSLACQQLCDEYGLQFQIDLTHHPIGQYLEPRCDSPARSIESIVNLQDIPNFTLRALKSQLTSKIKLKDLHHQDLHIYTNVWPIFKIRGTTAHKVRSFFVPNATLEEAIAASLPKNSIYGVIHIRAGDLLSFKTQIGDVVSFSLNDLLDIIHPYMNHLSGKNYVVMSDCEQLKLEISNRYGFECTSSKPTHLALAKEGTIDTLVDYFILSRATHIHQFSVHGWGSGFSDSVKWLYKIPVLKHKLSTTN